MRGQTQSLRSDLYDNEHWQQANIHQRVPALIRQLKRFLRRAGGSIQHAYSVSKLPYPVSVRRRQVETESIPPGGGPETFDQPESLAINQARLTHLASLQLPLEGKTVLDVGCGVGHLAQFFVKRDCSVVCVDGREQNIISLRSRYPGLVAHVANVDREPLAQFGMFDVVFCYGLLYHLENPLAALRSMASVCREILLLETLISDHAWPILQIIDEPMTFSQALAGLGCRPSPSYVVTALNRIGFRFVYAPKVPPEYRDFKIGWRNNLDAWRNGHPLRCTFVASRTELRNPRLVSLLED